jgi:hypothetical protein
MTETAQMPTEPQRLRALEHANAVRLARADIKRKIAEGETSAAAVILECPEAVRKWTVAELLQVPRTQWCQRDQADRCPDRSSASPAR